MDIKQKTPKHVAGFELEQMGDEYLLYSPQYTKTIYLNASAALVWNLSDGSNTVTQIIDLLKDAFPEASETIEADVIKSLEDLLHNQAVELN